MKVGRSRWARGWQWNCVAVLLDRWGHQNDIRILRVHECAIELHDKFKEYCRLAEISLELWTVSDMDEQLSHSSCVKSARSSSQKCEPEQRFRFQNDLDWTGNAINWSAIPLKDQLGDLQVEHFLFQSRQGAAEKMIKKQCSAIEVPIKAGGPDAASKNSPGISGQLQTPVVKLREQNRGCMRMSVLWKAGRIS